MGRVSKALILVSLISAFCFSSDNLPPCQKIPSELRPADSELSKSMEAAFTLAISGQLTKAIQTAEKALSACERRHLISDCATIEASLASAYFATGNFEKAEDLSQKALQHGRKPRSGCGSAPGERNRAQQRLEELDEAIAVVERLAGRNRTGYLQRSGSRSISAAGRKRISQAQKARWARLKGESNANATGANEPPKRRMSPAARKRIAAAQRARWAKWKAKQEKRAA